MKTLINSFIAAFSMYSTIPMPRSDLDKQSIKLSLCFFPMVGIIISAVFYGLWYVLKLYGISPGLSASVLIIIPVIISGGIHTDGFIDVFDAICSHKPRDEKLVVMKDPRAGAFGVISCVIYFVAQYGLLQQVYIDSRPVYVLLFGFIISRILAALSIISLPCAKKSGLAFMFAENSGKNAVRIFMLIYFSLCSVALVLLCGVFGVWVLIISIMSLVWYRRFVIKQFGGITGDTSGFYIMTVEILFVLLQCVGGTMRWI